MIQAFIEYEKSRFSEIKWYVEDPFGSKIIMWYYRYDDGISYRHRSRRKVEQTRAETLAMYLMRQRDEIISHLEVTLEQWRAIGDRYRDPSRFLLRRTDNSYNALDEVFELEDIAGYDLVTAGKFGGEMGDGLFLLLSRDGANKFLMREGNDKWSSKEGFDKILVNGFDFVAAGQFGGEGGDDLVFLNRNGDNRILRRKADGSYQRCDNELPTITGYDFVTAGAFGGQMGHSLFFLARDGRNLFVERDANGTWNIVAGFGTATVNGFDFMAAGKFAGTGGDDVFLMTHRGDNRILIREADGSYKEKDQHFDVTTVNGYDLLATGDFGGEVRDDLFFLRSRAQRPLIKIGG